MDKFIKTMNKSKELEKSLRTSTNRMTEDERTCAEIFTISISFGNFNLSLDERYMLECSYVYGYDSPRRLLDAFADLLENKHGERWILWPDEPTAKVLKLERAGDTLIMEVYETSKLSHNLNYRGPELWEHITDCVYKSDYDIMRAAKRLRNEFGLYKNGDGRQYYDHHWSFGFPQYDYDRLLSAIRNKK